MECAEPQKMLEFLRRNASDRKLRLFACACCRRIWHLLCDEYSHNAVAVAEHYGDGEATDEELAAVRRHCAGHSTTADYAAWVITSPQAFYAAEEAASDIPGTVGWASADYTEKRWEIARDGEDAAQSILLRDIFGNPLRPVSINPHWLTPAVLSIAQAAYDNCNLPSGTLDNARLAVLGDALEDAGCDNQNILNHLRQPGEHVRGCWCVDAILGKQ